MESGIGVVIRTTIELAALTTLILSYWPPAGLVAGPFQTMVEGNRWALSAAAHTPAN
jgi:hypothetical protein